MYGFDLFSKYCLRMVINLLSSFCWMKIKIYEWEFHLYFLLFLDHLLKE